MDRRLWERQIYKFRVSPKTPSNADKVRFDFDACLQRASDVLWCHIAGIWAQMSLQR